jgi:cytochrome c oxidase cbb3-type subunit 3
MNSDALYRTTVLTLAVIAAVAGAEGRIGVAARGQSPPAGITALAPSPPDGPPPDPVAVARGTTLYETTLNCAACHGVTGRGGPGNAPDVTRSALAMQPDNGRALAAFLRVGRVDKGMPAVPALTEAQAADLSAKLRSLGFAAAQAGSRGSGRGARPGWPAALTGQQLSIVVGDPALGRTFFNGPVGQCSSCHSVVDGEASTAANLAHIASKYPEPKTLQNKMVLSRDAGWSPRMDKDVTATITYPDGRTLNGYLSSVSDFKVVIRDDNGAETVIPRADGEPRVVLTDRLQHHLDLLAKYSDNDIHNLTAYLVTLK